MEASHHAIKKPSLDYRIRRSDMQRDPRKWKAVLNVSSLVELQLNAAA